MQQQPQLKFLQMIKLPQETKAKMIIIIVQIPIWLTSDGAPQQGALRTLTPRHDIAGYFLHTGNTPSWIQKQQE